MAHESLLLSLIPLYVALWYAVLSRKHYSCLVQVPIIVGGYIGVVWLVKERIIRL